MTCPRCASTQTNQSPGKGPHYASLNCSNYGRFIKWLPYPDSLEGRQRFIDRFTAIAKDKGYARGWVSHRFFERFNEWPDRFNPNDPEPKDNQ